MKQKQTNKQETKNKQTKKKKQRERNKYGVLLQKRQPSDQ